MSDQVIVQLDSVQNIRAKEIAKELVKLSDGAETSVFDMCSLLNEFQEKSYHEAFGYLRFNDWLSQSGLDISAQQAKYYIAIDQAALYLNIDRPTLKKVKLSKLRYIVSLDPAKYGKEMLELIEEAPSLTIDQVKARVIALRESKPVEEFVFMTLKFPKDAKETIEQAFEKCRMNASNDELNGNVTEISNGRVLELICADYMTLPDVEPIESEVNFSELNEGPDVNVVTGE